jgi:lipopolysaccharide transport system permease protein
MPLISLQPPRLSLHAGARRLTVLCTLTNGGSSPWQPGDFSIGWQIFDPETGIFISEGRWIPLPHSVARSERLEVPVEIEMPGESGRYHVYISPVRPTTGWDYLRNEPFLVLDAIVEHHSARVLSTTVTTVASLRRRRYLVRIPALFIGPLRSLWMNRALTATMVRRDILARYRGSFAGALWTVLNPLLLMATYFFVFGVVLQTRFGPEQSHAGFAFYFLAGMLPWLAFSDAVGRSPTTVLDHRIFVKKIVFPLETIPVIQAISALVTEFFALAIFLVAIAIHRGSVPLTAAWLPALLIPQLLFTVGCSWFLAALGVFVRDLGHISGFLLTLWFFVTPICYPEASLPHAALPILAKNPIYALVHAYRAVLLEGHPPEFQALWKLWLIGLVTFILGYAWFFKLRRFFADVI